MHILMCLLFLICPMMAYSATIPLYVGETGGLEAPDAVSDNGYIDNAVVLESDKNLYVDTSNPIDVKVTVVGYFSYTATVKIRYVEKYTYNGHPNKLDHDIEYKITAKYPTIKAVDSEITISLGEKRKLEYTVTPSGLLPPPMNWGPIDYYGYSLGYIDMEDDGYDCYVTGKKAGKAVVAALPYGIQNLGFVYIITVVGSQKSKLTLSASPNGGQVTSGTIVTLTAKADGSTVTGCDIYFTTDGSNPSRNNGTKYSSGVTINSVCTLKAIAYKSGYEDSDVLTATYTIKQETKPKLTLSASPSGGQVTSGTTVTLTAKANGSTVSGCDIYFTTNGSNPSRNNGTKYSSGITISSACTLKAIAYKDGYEDSEVLTETYTIKQEQQGKLDIFATINSGQTSSSTIVKLKAYYNGFGVEDYEIYYTLDGTTPTKNSARYTSSGIIINGDYTMKAIACKDGHETSDVFFISLTKEGVPLLYKEINPYQNTCEIADIVPINHYEIWTKSEEMTIPDVAYGYDVIAIGNSAFQGSSANGYPFKRIFLPESIIKIGDLAFYMCEELETIILPSNVEEIGESAFGDCEKLSTVNITGNLIKIGERAFEDCKMLESIKLPNTLTTIGANAFKGCGLTTFTLPKSVFNIDSSNAYLSSYGGDNILYKCEKLKEIIVESGNNYYDSRDDCNAIIETSTNKMISACINSTIPNTVSALGMCCFSFVDINSIHLPSSLLSIGQYAFYECSKLNTVTIPKDVQFIGEEAFAWCNKLKSVTSEIISPTPIGQSVFSSGTYSSGTLTVPFGAKGTYQSLDGWNKFQNIVESQRTLKLVLSASPSSGQITKGATLYLTVMADGTAVSGCDIYYTLNGTTPSKSSTKYTSKGITISSACTLKAIAYKDGYETSDVLTETYTIKKDDIRVNIASSGYATFYSSESAFKLPNGLSAKVVKDAGNGKLTYETIVIIDGNNANIVPRGVPVMIESNTKQTGTFTLTAVQSTASYTGTNLLRGSDEATTTTGDGLHYKLSYGPSGTKWDDVFGWYWGTQNGAPFQIEGHKAWLVVPKGNGTRAAGFSVDGEVLGIVSLDRGTDSPIDDCYDLQGRRVSQPAKKGIYIINGKKVVK